MEYTKMQCHYYESIYLHNSIAAAKKSVFPKHNNNTPLRPETTTQNSRPRQPSSKSEKKLKTGSAHVFKISKNIFVGQKMKKTGKLQNPLHWRKKPSVPMMMIPKKKVVTICTVTATHKTLVRWRGRGHVCLLTV